jgi:hypothetical protein
VSALLFRNVSEAERGRAHETLVSAFINDPIERWMYPKLEQYLAHCGFPRASSRTARLAVLLVHR